MLPFLAATLETIRKIFPKKDSREPACQAHNVDLVMIMIRSPVPFRLVMIVTSNV